jgi:hypothetical protein
VSKTLIIAAASALVISSFASADSAGDPNVAEGNAIIKEFFTSLKGELQAAIKQGGPVSAIEVCQERAPAIAFEISEKTGWDVGRTSLKLRNPSLNSPDEWERKILVSFEQRKAAGEAVETMTHAEEVETDEGKRFRFMKAIPTGEVCLACHGGAITPEVAAAIDEAYPEDQARGFALGDIRGAFTLSKPL